MKESTTLKKISQALNLSVSTVSRALKNHPDISDKTKRKVTDLATLLEYEPNAYAIQLRTNNSKVFGLMIPTLSYFFYDSFIAAMEEECRANGYSLIILQSGDDPAIELENLKFCRQNRVSGLFVCISSDTSSISSFLKLDESGIPVVFFDKVPEFEACNKVCLADAAAAKLAAETIIRKKRKAVLALFGNIKLSISKRRLAAFTDTFKVNNNKNLKLAYVQNAEEANLQLHAAFKSKDKPATIFCMSDEILTGVMKAIQEMKLKVPEDIAVISISNGIIPKLYYPEITYVETSGYKLGKLAFTRMMACLAGRTFVQELTVDAILVEGGSI